MRHHLRVASHTALKDYSLSFTAASLMFFETEQVVHLFLEHNDWQLVAQLVVDDNIMQKGTVSTRKREFAEIKKRLIGLSTEEMEFMVSCTTDELKLYCLYLCAKTYRLIFEFISEVVRDKYLMFDYAIFDSDYSKFIEAKTASSEKLQSITEKTQYKIKQVIFRILEQSTLIDSTKTRNVQKPYISDELQLIIARYNSKYLSCFLYADGEIAMIRENLND